MTAETEAERILCNCWARDPINGGPHTAECAVQDYGAAVAQALAARDAEIGRLRVALKPFAAIFPSTLYPFDGSEAETYIVMLQGDHGNPAEFTGADLARARSALAGEKTDG